MKIQCPHCNKDISIRVDGEDSLGKDVARATEGLRQEITRLRQENKELSKQLEPNK